MRSRPISQGPERFSRQDARPRPGNVAFNSETVGTRVPYTVGAPCAKVRFVNTLPDVTRTYVALHKVCQRHEPLARSYHTLVLLWAQKNGSSSLWEDQGQQAGRSEIDPQPMRGRSNRGNPWLCRDGASGGHWGLLSDSFSESVRFGRTTVLANRSRLPCSPATANVQQSDSIELTVQKAESSTMYATPSTETLWAPEATIWTVAIRKRGVSSKVKAAQFSKKLGRSPKSDGQILDKLRGLSGPLRVLREDWRTHHHSKSLK